MPVYEYQCNACGERTQRLQEVGEDSSGRKCLSCEKGVIRKVFSVFGTLGNTSTHSCSTQPARRSR